MRNRQCPTAEKRARPRHSRPPCPCRSWYRETWYARRAPSRHTSAVGGRQLSISTEQNQAKRSPGGSAHQKRNCQQETNMSSDNTPHPPVKDCADKVNARFIHGRPEHELVPSRYALKVGEIDVMVVSDGVLSLPGAMLGHNADPAVRAAWLEDMFLPPDVLEWALNVVMVRSGGRTILVDVGIGMEFPDLPRA